MRHPFWIVVWTGLFVFFFVSFYIELPSVVIWTTAGVMTFLLCAVLITVDVRARLAIQRDIREGRPNAVLERVDVMLGDHKGRRNRGPLLLHRASALTLKGQWDEALRIVEGLGVDDLPRMAQSFWLIYHASIAFDCLMFLERPHDAKALFNARIVPAAHKAGAEQYALLLDECRAMIAYHDGDLEQAAALFQRLLEPESRPPVVRAYGHYFLGLIAQRKGAFDVAREHFERAASQSSETIIAVKSSEARQALRAES